MIVAVSGGKGGVGKSTIARNVGRALDAVVIDADLARPALPVETEPTLNDVLQGRARPIDAVEEIGSIRFVPSGDTLTTDRRAQIARLPKAVEAIEDQYGRVVLDCAAGIDRDVGFCLYCADACILVTVPEQPAMVDLLRTKGLVDDVETPVVALVVNRCGPETPEPLVERLGQKLGVEPVTVPTTTDIEEANAAGRAVTEQFPDSPIVDSFIYVANRVTRYEERPTP